MSAIKLWDTEYLEYNILFLRPLHVHALMCHDTIRMQVHNEDAYMYVCAQPCKPAPSN